MYRKNAALLITVGLLCALEYLQAGMIAFASAPIRGEIDASPEAVSYTHLTLPTNREV